MKQRYRFVFWGFVLLVLVTLMVWQGSFTFGDLGPQNLTQTFVFWALSTLIFVLTVALGFMLFRSAVRLYMERRANIEGSRIRSKILIGALALTFLPTIFLVIWSVEVLNRNLDKWFSRPAENVRLNLQEIGETLEREEKRTGETVAYWLADSEELRKFLATGQQTGDLFTRVCQAGDVEEAFVIRPDGGQISICQDATHGAGTEVESRAALPGGGQVVVRARAALDLTQQQREIQKHIGDYEQLRISRKETRIFYLLLLLLITLFVLFVATWIALFLARQISTPISALVEAAEQVRSGNLSHRVKVGAIDEFATLVRSFNEMAQNLETSRAELEGRQRFIEAVLESIPTGVISLSYDGRIQLCNAALEQIFPPEKIKPGARLGEILPAEDQSAFSRLMKRARRTGIATQELEMKTARGVRHVSVTVSSLAEKVTAGFVIVLEDTSELLRAQKAAAWHEVARRIAHEIKNPLTPISLSSERIIRQLDRSGVQDTQAILRECAATIAREVQSVKTLVDEFSRFSRFPAAQPAPGDLNEVVEESLAVFTGRLGGIQLHRDLAPVLPPVLIDREQFKRVIVNLVDNAAEAMQEAPLKRLYVTTQVAGGDSVELIIADTGSGFSVEDKEKLFLPYFSTKQRGTGLGLAIASHVVAEHRGHIRVEDNRPTGARFIIDLPVAASSDAVEGAVREGATLA